jgi:hypothetical protein
MRGIGQEKKKQRKSNIFSASIDYLDDKTELP